MLFFKYQKPGNLEFGMLRRGEVFFASPRELNDASECRPRYVLSGSVELWERFGDYLLTSAVIQSPDYEQTSVDHRRNLFQTGSAIGRQLKRQAKNRDVGLEELAGLFADASRNILLHVTVADEVNSIIDSARNLIERWLPTKLADHKYIASFSTIATNPTMWGHYAAAEKGFVIIYSSDDSTVKVRSTIPSLHGFRHKVDDVFGGEVTEIGNYNDECLELQPVQYRKKPPKMNALRELVPRFHFSEQEAHYDVPELMMGDANAKEEGKIGLVKYSEWRYEKEVRAFYPTFDDIPPDLRVLQVDAHQIRGVVFGPKMSARDKERTKMCCNLMRNAFLQSHQVDGKLPEFSFFEARQRLDRFDFDFTHIGTLETPGLGNAVRLIRYGDLEDAAAASVRQIEEEIAGVAT